MLAIDCSIDYICANKPHMTEPISHNNCGRYALEKKTILSLCSSHQGFSMADFARIIGASIPKVTRIVNEMVAQGYLVDLGKTGSSGGRRASIFGLNPNVGYFVGVHVEQERITLAVTDFPGQMVCPVERVPFRLEQSEQSCHQLCLAVRNCLESRMNLVPSKIAGYGVNLTGRVNHRTGYSYSFFISEEKPFRTILEADLGKPVMVENDSRAMAWGEYMSSFPGTEGDILFLNVGWGLGMGMVMDGELYYGKSGFSGEIGHFPLLDNNVPCRCGKIGCLETGASGSALHRLVTEKLAEGRASVLSEAYGRGKELTLDGILEAVEKEDVLCIECVEKVGETLGRAVAGLINIFNPSIVVIGGRLCVTEKYLIPPLRSTVNKLSLNLVNSDTMIKVSQLGEKAGAIGASLLAKHCYLQKQ